jgi:hypothetical protein
MGQRSESLKDSKCVWQNERWATNTSAVEIDQQVTTILPSAGTASSELAGTR